MEGAAERDAGLAGAIPAHFDDRALHARAIERGDKARRIGAGVEDNIGIGLQPRGEIGGGGEVHAEGRGEGGAGGFGIGEDDARTRQLGGQEAHQQAGDAATDDADAIGRGGAGIPQRVECRLHIGGEYGAGGGHVVRHLDQHGERRVEHVLVRMLADDALAHQIGRAGLDQADGAIAVFHRMRKIARLHRRAHALVFGGGNAALEDQAFGAAADAGGQHADARRAGFWIGQVLGAECHAAWRVIPQGPCQDARHEAIHPR